MLSLLIELSIPMSLSLSIFLFLSSLLPEVRMFYHKQHFSEAELRQLRAENPLPVSKASPRSQIEAQSRAENPFLVSKAPPGINRDSVKGRKPYPCLKSIPLGT